MGIDIVDFFHLVAAGKVQGLSSLTVIGHNGAIGTSTTFISCAASSATPHMPTSATTIEAISDSANDTANGSGARTIYIAGLDANWDPAEAIITMNGTSASSATSVSFIRVTTARVLTTGTYSSANAGLITVRASGAGTTFLLIPASEGLCRTSHFCVPRGQTWYRYDAHANVEASKTVTIKTWLRLNANQVTAPYSPAVVAAELTGLSQTVDIDYKNAPVAIPQMTDVWADGIVATGSAGASTAFTLVAVRH